MAEKMAETFGVTVEDVDDSFFADKDEDFFKAQLQILLDFAAAFAPAATPPIITIFIIKFLIV